MNNFNKSFTKYSLLQSLFTKTETRKFDGMKSNCELFSLAGWTFPFIRTLFFIQTQYTKFQLYEYIHYL